MKIVLVGIKPVSTNDMYMPVASRSKSGKYYARIIASDALRQYKSTIHDAINRKLKEGKVSSKMDPNKLYKLDIEVSFPKKDFMTSEGELKQVDASNVIKSLEDGIYEALGVNDKQNIEVTVRKYYNNNDTYIIQAEIMEIKEAVLQKDLESYL